MISRRDFLRAAGVGVAGVAGASLLPQIMGANQALAAPDKSSKMNVLLIMVDDLRPEIRCFGDTLAVTPNIDKLASQGTMFSSCYTPQATCSPARTCILTGMRPDTTKVYDLVTHFRKNLPDVVTLPQWFKQAGYQTQGFGKVYHDGLDDAASWSAPSFWPPGEIYALKESLNYVESRKKLAKEQNVKPGDLMHFTRGPAWECADLPDEAYQDGQTAAEVIKVMGQVKDKPFFLAAGFRKPHLPFVSPKKYWDLYNPDDIKLPDNPSVPKDCPDIAYTSWPELRGFKDMPDTGPVDDKTARKLIHAYRAAVSFTDAQIGKLLAELDRLGLRQNTLVVLIADHGWKLGEHGLWSKHTNFEWDTRVPLIVSAPGQKDVGTPSPALVESVDVYPTICGLCGVGLPKQELEGASLIPLLEDPARPWKKAAFSQFPRPKGVMGYSIRTEKYRFNIWQEPDQKVLATELYDHQAGGAENVNIAGKPENAALVQQLTAQLHSGWKGNLPA